MIRNLIRSFRSTQMILMYHRVNDITPDPWDLCVSVENFEVHLNILKKHGFSFLSLKKLHQSKIGGWHRKNVSISFDDGYLDNFMKAKPVLERLDIPATFFIVSGAVGNKEEFWWDHLERLIVHSRNLPDILKFSGKNIKIEKTYKNKIDLYKEIWEHFSDLSVLEKQSALQEFSRQIHNAPITRPNYWPMNTKQLKELSTHSLFEIGAHTVNHPMLERLSVQEQNFEITESKKQLEEIIGKKILSFSLPHGSLTKETPNLLQKAGYERACSSRNENICNNDSFLLPRRFIPNWDVGEFERRLQLWMQE